MEENPRLSVIIPSYNEESRLPGTLDQVHRYLMGRPYRAEVLVVDDGSTDGTVPVVTESSISMPELRLVRHPDRANHGKGAAIRAGMREARGDYRIFMDADNSTTIDQIENFWPWFERHYDLVIGSRRIKGAQILVHQAWYKELAGRFGNLVVRTLAVPGIEDTQAGFKMFTRRCADAVFPHLTIDRWGHDIEVLAVARLKGCKVKEVPITWINAPGSKVGAASYLEVLRETWLIRCNIRAGLYRNEGDGCSDRPHFRG